MRYHPLSRDRDYYSRVMNDLLRRGWPAAVELAGPGIGEIHKGEPKARIDADARFSITLTGQHRYAISRHGARRDAVLAPGRALYWPPHAWNVAFWHRPCLYFGVVFRQSFTRYLMVDYRGGTPPTADTVWAWHSSRPIGGAGAHMVRAINAYAVEENPDRDLARDLLTDLLKLSLRHLETEEEPRAENAVRRTWQLAVEHINQHYADSMLSRERVAEAIGVHPNYLSNVAAREGAGFQRTLEGIRIARARHLLQETKAPLSDIARHCGYSCAISFLRAYKRVTGTTPGANRQGGRLPIDVPGAQR